MAEKDKKVKHVDGDKVLCFHGPLLYEGKIQKTKVKDKVTKYFVHYSGWNTKWDEWVAESRVMKFSEESVKKQKELKQHHLLSKKGKKKDTKDEKKDDAPPPSKKRKGRASNNHEHEPSYVKKMEAKIVIPHDLRRYLLDDCDFVTRQKQLVPLPKIETLTVKGILGRYKKQREEFPEDIKNQGTISEMCHGIYEYFNVMLGSQLLYKFERMQYSDILKDFPDKTLCEIYGAEHLLRLLVKLGRVMGYSCLDEPSMEFVVVHIHDFLDFLMKHSEDLFAAEYENSTPDYHRRVAV